MIDLFQSTLLQEERQFGEPITSFLPYFNPRSYKRSDENVEEFKTWGPLFQSTLLQEERHSARVFHCSDSDISIHAPTRGATLRHISLIHSNNYFNPRSYKRSDPCTSSLCSGMLLFQSTLLQEERPLRYDPGLILPDFNPRSYKRSDQPEAQRNRG